MAERERATAAAPIPTRRRALGGLYERRECWALTWRGKLAVLIFGVALFLVALVSIHPFLAVTVRPTPDVLVVEGWIPDYALVKGWEEFQQHHYTTFLTVGEPLRGGYNLDPDDDYGDLAAYKLRKMVGKNIPVQAVRCARTRRDRTYTCGLTVKQWLADHHQTPASVTVFTVGPHARRSRLLYEKAFGPSVPIGVIALKSEDYDARRWWRSSEGVKELISEAVAYFYVRLFFHKSDS